MQKKQIFFAMMRELRCLLKMRIITIGDITEVLAFMQN